MANKRTGAENGRSHGPDQVTEAADGIAAADDGDLSDEFDDYRWVGGPTWLLLRTAMPRLPPRQQRVARVLLSQRAEQIARLSVADVARMAEASPATVVRTCQEVGFSGFRHLVVLLARDARPGDEQATIDTGVGGAGVAGVAAGYLRRVAKAVEQGADSIDPASFEAAVRAVTSARRVLVISYGWSLGAGQGMALRLSAIGRWAEAPTDAYAQLVAARNLTESDVCLLVSFTGNSVQATHTAAAAHAAGATVVSITALERSTSAAYADISVVFGPPELMSDEIRSLTGSVTQMAVMEALYVGVAQHLGDAARRALDASLRVVTDQDEARGH